MPSVTIATVSNYTASSEDYCLPAGFPYSAVCCPLQDPDASQMTAVVGRRRNEGLSPHEDRAPATSSPSNTPKALESQIPASWVPRQIRQQWRARWDYLPYHHFFNRSPATRCLLLASRPPPHFHLSFKMNLH